MDGAADLGKALDMLRRGSMEKQFKRLRAGTLLAELRSAVSLVHTDATVSMGASLKLTFCIQTLASPLRELLDQVLHTDVPRAEAWHQVPAALYRYHVFRSATVRDLRQFLRKFRSLASYVRLNHTPHRLLRHEISSSSSSGRDDRDALRQHMVGRSEMLEKMVHMLLADRTDDEDGLLVMPIVGGPGVGKTRLAKAILDDDRVRLKFSTRIVVPVTHHYRLERILMLMVSPERRASSLEAIATHISGMLNEQGDYLIVLDDVWSDSQGKWRDIATVMKLLPSNGRVVLTTRTPDIAAKLATIAETADTKPLYVQPLDQEFSPVFVAKWVTAYHGDWPPELVTEAAMKIAGKCSSVPLLLHYAGRVFCEPQGTQFWQGFLLDNTGYRQIDPCMFWQELLACIDDLPCDKFWQQLLGHGPEHPAGKKLVLESASVSYQHFPSDIRGCFLYCSMFPPDYDFDAEELADRLETGGYIPPMVAEARRKGFLRQLLDECFYPIQQHEYGDKTAYRMHKVLHIFAQKMDWKSSSVMRPDQATQVTTETRAQSSIRRASLIVHPSTASFPRNLFLCKDLGALILLQDRTMCSPEQPRCRITEIPQKDLQSFELIHTLSFRATKIRMLPTRFLKPQYVKYLNLSQTDITKVPKSISKLLSLQTLVLSHCDKLRKMHRNITKLALLQKLDLEGCCNLVELPQDMSKMKNLEYLNVAECSSLTQLPRGMGQLKSLQKLLGYIVSDNADGSSMSELQSLANLHRLSLQSLERVSDLLDVRYARLERKTKLESLSLRWNMDDSNNTTPASAVLASLQPHRRLKALEIIAYQGERLPFWMTTTEPYLMSLLEIKLINLGSSENVLPPLGLLPCLKIVEISGAETVSCVGDSFYGPNGTFPSLEKLTFSYMQNLEVWEQAHRAGMFPRLAELAIIQCPKFRALHMELPSVKLILWMNNKVLHGQKGALRGVAKNLELISISFSEELLASSDCEGLKDLCKLTKLEICGCDELTCLPQGLKHLSSIRSLTIENCSKLETLPDWLENPPSLQIIRLSCCPTLHYIPEGLQQRPGVIVYIEDCPNLPEQTIANFPAQSSGEPDATQVNKGNKIVKDDG